MIRVDESDPVGEVEPTFPYRDVVIKRDADIRDAYDLEMEIGRGKFGTVHKCKEKSSGMMFAVKFVSTTRKEDKKEVEREIDIMNSLHHPRLLQLYDAIDDGVKEMCLVLELIQGGELFERVIDDDFILTEKACSIFTRQVCEGIEFMHSQKILHLDMKPENILCLTKCGNRIKLIDFGLARRYDPSKKLQVLFGTPEFVAPEVVNFDQIGFGTDMWSIGVICYVLLSGLSPFMGNSDVETMANVTVATYDFDDEAFNDISDDAKDFINKLLVKDMNLRLSATDCLEHNWLQRKPPVPPPPAPEPETSEGSLEITKSNLRTFVERWNEHPNSPYVYTPNRALSLASIPKWSTVSGSNVSMAIVATSPASRSLHSQDVSEFEDDDETNITFSHVHDPHLVPININLPQTETDTHGDILLEDFHVYPAQPGGRCGDQIVPEVPHVSSTSSDARAAEIGRTTDLAGSSRVPLNTMQKIRDVSSSERVSTWVQINFRDSNVSDQQSAVVQRSSNVSKRPKRERPLVRDDSGEYVTPIIKEIGSTSFRQMADSEVGSPPVVEHPQSPRLVTDPLSLFSDSQPHLVSSDEYCYNSERFVQQQINSDVVSPLVTYEQYSDVTDMIREDHLKHLALSDLTPTANMDLPFFEDNNLGPLVRIIPITLEQQTEKDTLSKVRHIPVTLEQCEAHSSVNNTVLNNKGVVNNIFSSKAVSDTNNASILATQSQFQSTQSLLRHTGIMPAPLRGDNDGVRPFERSADRSMVLSTTMKELIDEIASVGNRIEEALEKITLSDTRLQSSSHFSEHIIEIPAGFSKAQGIGQRRLSETHNLHSSLPIINLRENNLSSK